MNNNVTILNVSVMTDYGVCVLKCLKSFRSRVIVVLQCHCVENQYTLPEVSPSSAATTDSQHHGIQH